MLLADLCVALVGVDVDAEAGQKLIYRTEYHTGTETSSVLTIARRTTESELIAPQSELVMCESIIFLEEERGKAKLIVHLVATLSFQLASTDPSALSSPSPNQFSSDFNFSKANFFVRSNTSLD